MWALHCCKSPMMNLPWQVHHPILSSTHHQFGRASGHHDHCSVLLALLVTKAVSGGLPQAEDTSWRRGSGGLIMIMMFPNTLHSHI